MITCGTCQNYNRDAKCDLGVYITFAHEVGLCNCSFYIPNTQEDTEDDIEEDLES